MDRHPEREDIGAGVDVAGLEGLLGFPGVRGGGLPVPPGFTLSTDVCTYFYDNGKNYPEEMQAQVDTALARLEKLTGKKYIKEE